LDGVVAVVGDSIVDSYVVGKSTRLSPEAPVPVVDVTSTTYCPGGAANVACGVQAMNVPAILISPIGNDPMSGKIPEMVSHYGVLAVTPYVYSWHNPIKKRVVSNGQYSLRLDEESEKLHETFIGFASYETLLVNKVLDLALSGVGRLKAVIISDYSKGAVTSKLVERIVTCKTHDPSVLIVGDVKTPRFLHHLDLVSPNFKEACAFAVKQESDYSIECDKSCEDLCRDILLRHRGLGGVVVTRGSFGCSWALTDTMKERLNTCFQQGSFQAYPVCSADPTGAGDTFVATLVSSLANGNSFYNSISNANASAAIAVAAKGTHVVTQMALFNFTESIKSKQSAPKVMSFTSMLTELHRIRTPNTKVVFTNGCFDMLHVGHADLLEKAKQQGDYLIVAVDSDESVKTLKGPNRPFVTQDNRLKMVASLGCVDAVVSFGQGELEHIISLINPDVLVKGAEYSSNPENIPGYTTVKNNGGNFVAIPMIEGVSTTTIAASVADRFSTRS
jgi:D-beta-D-heptose 7-phosphate kinase / D-beta-D-heptose 1-phosphate adenosyltransferase